MTNDAQLGAASLPGMATNTEIHPARLVELLGEANRQIGKQRDALAKAAQAISHLVSPLDQEIMTRWLSGEDLPTIGRALFLGVGDVRRRAFRSRAIIRRAMGIADSDQSPVAPQDEASGDRPQLFDTLANDVTSYIRAVEHALREAPFQMNHEYLPSARGGVGFGRSGDKWRLYAVLPDGTRKPLADEASLQERIECASMLPMLVSEMKGAFESTRSNLESAIGSAREALKLIREGK